MRLLYRHFLRGMARSDVLPPDSDPRAIWIAAAAGVSAPAMMLCIYQGWWGYSDVRPLLSCFLVMAGLLAALTAVIEWDELLPTRTDFLVLGPLPLPAGALPASKLAALATMLAAAAALANGAWIVLFPLVTAPGADNMPLAIRGMAAHCLMVGLESLAAISVVLTLRCLGDWIGDGFSRAVRLGCAVAVLSALAVAPALSAPSLFHFFSRWGWPGHVLLIVLGIDRALAGIAASPAGTRAVVGCVAAAIAVAAMLYALSWRKRQREALARVAESRRPTAWPVYERWLLRQPRARAVFRFSRLTLTRSSRHGLSMSVWLAVGSALTLAELGWQRWQAAFYSLRDLQVAVLAAPLVICFFLLVGLRQIVSIPITLRSQWLFRMAEGGAETERLDAARHLFLAYAIVPVLAPSVPLYVWLWGWTLALPHLVYCGLLALILAELLLARWPKLPFTCVHVPGRANVKMLFPFYWLAFTTFAYGSCRLELVLFAHPFQLVLLLFGLLMVYLVLVRRDGGWRATLTGCQFDDEPEPVVLEIFGSEGIPSPNLKLTPDR